MFLPFFFLHLYALTSRFKSELLYFSCYLESWLTLSVLSGKKKTILFAGMADNIKQRFSQMSGRLYCLVNKFRAVCKVFTCFDSEPHYHM